MSKKLQTDWKVILGESAVDIRVGRLTQGLQRESHTLVGRLTQGLQRESHTTSIHTFNCHGHEALCCLSILPLMFCTASCNHSPPLRAYFQWAFSTAVSDLPHRHAVTCHTATHWLATPPRSDVPHCHALTCHTAMH